MLADVTQMLQLHIIPVNTPQARNKYGERQGYYTAYVSHDYHALIQAKQEWARGIVPSFVGYGSSGEAREAAANALLDYENKFGPLCITDTNDEFGDMLTEEKE